MTPPLERITREKMKILKSEKISDFPDSGGRVTSLEVIDGKSNDIFLDIPDTSRAYGDLDMVKVYPAVTTETNEPLLGAVFSLGRVPEDPSVNITLFSTKDWFDTRQKAIKTLESYLAPAARIEGELLDLQLKGQQVIQVIQDLTAVVPTVGKSLYIIQDEGKPTAFDQYVFVTAVTVEERSFRTGAGQVKKFKVCTLELSTKLDFNFQGVSATAFDTGGSAPAVVRDTRVADTANYYTTKPLQTAVGVGAAVVKIEDIFTQLVPSARQDNPLSGLNPSGTSQALVPTGLPITTTLQSYKPSSSVSYNFGVPIVPSTMSLSFGGVELLEDNGEIKLGTVTVGFIDYNTGILSWLSSYNPSNATLVMTYVPAEIVPTLNASLALEVTEGNRGLTLPWTLDNPPLAGSVVVTYLVLGDIYTLKDLGGGILKGSSESFGVGRINYQTGDLLLTFGSEPDVGSHILITWATLDGVSLLSPTLPSKLAFTHQFAAPTSGFRINTASMQITWAGKTATLSGNKVVGDATGTFDPKTRTLQVEPNVLPPKGTAYSITYKQLPVSTLSLSGSSAVILKQEPSTYHKNDALVLNFTIPVSDPNLIRSSFRFSINVRKVKNNPFREQFGTEVVEFSTTSEISGDVAPLFFYSESGNYNEFGNPDFTLYATKVGTINFATGAVTIVVSAATYTWWSQEYYPDYVTSYSGIVGAARYVGR